VTIAADNGLVLDATDCLVYGGGKLTALLGVRDLIVVDTPDALLVCHRERAQDVKRLVETLDKKGLTDYL
jgi:mannose-1-phosphate guanylyltransferase